MRSIRNKGLGYMLFGSSVAAICAAASGAVAQQQQQQQSAEVEELALEEIVVTGSRIRRAGFDTVQPAVQVDSDFIDARGFTNVAEALNEIPAFGIPGSSNLGGQGTQNVGQNFVNAFGLGSQRTLTLINGRRTVGQNTPTTVGNGAAAGLQVDLNIIPTALIDRVETVFVGGSPIYGSDAVAGTVNVILKDDFEGIDTDTQFGISDNGDTENFRIRGLWGGNFADGRGNAVVAAEFVHQNNLDGNQRQRALDGFGFCENPEDTGPNDGVPDELFCKDSINVWQVPNTGLPVVDPFRIAVNQAPGQPPLPASVVNNASGAPLVFDVNGRLTTFEEANLGSIDTIFFSQGANCGPENDVVTCLPETNTLVSPLNRWIVTGNAHYNITDDTRFFVETLTARSESTDRQNQPPWSIVAFGPGQQGTIKINLNDNPFLHPADREIIRNDIGEDAEFMFMNRSNIDVVEGAPNTRIQDVIRIVSGLEGQWDVFGQTLNWEGYYTYGVTDSLTSQSTLNGRRFSLAIDSVAVTQEDVDAITAASGSSPFDVGEIACRSRITSLKGELELPKDGAQGEPNIPNEISSCIPFNPFGIQELTPEQRQFLIQQTKQDTEIRQQVAAFNVDGDLFELPAGNFAVAAGYLHRRESGKFNVGQGTQLGIDPNAPVQNVAGDFNTHEIYAEGLIPLVSNHEGLGFRLPVVSSIELNAAARFVDNSVSGNEVTWSAGGRMGLDLPFFGENGLTIRGNFTQSIRSPSIPELFLPTSEIFTFANDPCDPRFTDSGPVPDTRRENCEAAFSQFLATAEDPAVTDLDNFVAIITNASQPATTGGNRDLQNEVADSWTVGGVFTPDFLPGLQLTIDWTKITLNDAIVQISGTQLLNACFDSQNFPNAPACDRFSRDPETFQIQNPELGFLNAATRLFSGLVANLRYSTALSDLFGGDAPGTLTLTGNFFHTHRHEQTVNDQDLDIFAGEQGFEKFRVQLNLQYDYDRFMFLWQTRHTNGGSFDVQANPEARDINRFPAFRVHNMTLAYQITDNVRTRFVINNVLDEVDDPLLAASIGGNANLFNDIIGRRIQLGVNVSF